MTRREPTKHEVHKHKLYLKSRGKYKSHVEVWNKAHEAGEADGLQHKDSNNLGTVIEIISRHNQNMITYLNAKLATLKRICKERGHNIAPTQLDWDKWHAGSAVCLDCGEHLGWYCPENPDPKKPYCEYGKADYGCDHCNMPQERE